MAAQQVLIDEVNAGRLDGDAVQTLTISAKTVNAHMEHIYAKLGVSSRGGAALFAMRHGLIAVGDPAE